MPPCRPWGQRGRKGQTLEADVPQLVGHEAGQQGGQSAEDDVHDGGAQQVCEEAAQHHAENVLGTEHGQQAERLGHTHLHRAVRERLQCHAEHVKNSVVLLEQIRTLDKKRLKEYICHVDGTFMEEVNEAIRISLELPT